MNLTGQAEGHSLYALLNDLRVAKATGTIELKGEESAVLFFANGGLVYLEGSNPASSLPAFLMNETQIGREQVLASLEYATANDVSLPEAVLAVTGMEKAALAQIVRDHGMALLASLFRGGSVNYVVEITPLPRMELRLLQIPIVFGFLKAQISVQLSQDEIRASFKEFDIPLHPTPLFGTLKNGLLAVFDSPSGKKLVQALSNGPITLTELVAQGCDAMECHRAAKALLSAFLVHRAPSQRSQALWGSALDFATAFSSQGGRPVASSPPATAAPTIGSSPSEPRRPLRTVSGNGAGDTAVEQALANTLQKLTEASHFYDALGLKPDDSVMSIEERLTTLQNKYASDRYSGFLLSEDGLSTLSRVQDIFSEARETLTNAENRQAYHEAREISEDSMRVPLSAVMEAEQLSQTAREREEIDAHEEAVTFLEQAVALVPHCPHRMTDLALFIFEGLRNEKLEGEDYSPQVDKLLAQAIALETPSSRPHRVKGMIMEKRDMLSEAVTSFQKALALNPGDNEAKDGMRRVKAQLRTMDAEQTGEESGNVVSKLSGMLFKR